MRTKKATAHGQEFEIKYSIWNGREQIFYNGRMVSNKRSFMYVTPHIFKENENGEEVIYEINLFSSLSGSVTYVIRRNGIPVAYEE